MNRKEIEERIIELIHRVGKVELEHVIELSSTIDSYLNSITYIQFIIAMEEAFDFELDDQELDPENFQSFNDVVEHIEKRLAE